MKNLYLYLLTILSAALLSFAYETDDYIEFTAYLAEGKVNIQWTAYKRSKIARFILERSHDNKVYTAFKTIEDEAKNRISRNLWNQILSQC
ncbi:MAG: hypothetical protein Salg2KO_13780 [Salibacteraceae bacterium]